MSSSPATDAAAGRLPQATSRAGRARPLTASARIRRGLVAILIALLAGAGPGRSAEIAPGRLALRNARVLTLTASGELRVWPRGTVIVNDGRIEAVGESVPVPDGANVVDLEGQWLLPGFIDAHYLAERHLREGNETTEAITEDFEVLAAVDPWRPEWSRPLRLGVTTVAVSPGDANLVGGLIRTVKVFPGRYPLRRVDGPRCYKASFGESVLGGPGLPRFPTAYSGAVVLFEKWLEGLGRRLAPEVSAGPPGAWGRPEGTLTSSPGGLARTDEDHDTGPEVPRVVVRVDTRTQAELVFRLFAGKPLVPVILNGSEIDPEAWSRLPHAPLAVLGPRGLGDLDPTLEVAGALEHKNALLAFGSEGTGRDLLTTAVLSRAHGLSLRGALAVLTLHPARIYGIERHVGRIAAGLDADLVAWSGSPFSLTARVVHVWIDGESVYTADPGPGAGREEGATP